MSTLSISIENRRPDENLPDEEGTETTARATALAEGSNRREPPRRRGD
jgi:hypothetical protein